MGIELLPMPPPRLRFVDATAAPEQTREVPAHRLGADPQAVWAQGNLPPVWANVLDTIFHAPSILARDRKSVKETAPQNPSSATTT